ncbi:uncharacterized protein [Temnothorax nylanderi]|uniref:uncharacterized protein n=1 Tax=Temnothorax nylanderi TaxID=102681 RepID=UPI003A891D54
MQKYAIVEFIEENSVEIILSSWICPNNKTALWPKNITSSSLKRYLKNCTPPSDDWNSVNIRVLGHTDSLAHATKKAYKAQDTSHLSSSDSDLESHCTSKRQKKLPYRFAQDASTSSDDENLASEKHINSEKRTKRPVVPSFPDVQDDCEITELNQHKKKLQRDSQATNCSTMCNNNKKIQSKEVNTKLQRDSQATNGSTMCNDNEKIQRSEEVNTQKSTNIIQQKKEEFWDRFLN